MHDVPGHPWFVYALGALWGAGVIAWLAGLILSLIEWFSW
jgi:hypothetical protein